ncbi:MAG: GTP-dependent dephospho-CoA kinase family protein [Candidatus Thermoplasmatota archaeon]
MSGHEIPKKDLRLKKEQRNRLKKTLGTIVEGELPESYADSKPIIAVGDVVTEILLEQDIIPDVGMIDQKTRRGEYESGMREKEAFDIEIEIKNPPEMMTHAAWNALQKALNKEEPVLIDVEGEEDLLSLAAIALCPDGGVVIYGVPSEGMVINEVSDDIKEKAWEVINNMIEVDEGR